MRLPRVARAAKAARSASSPETWPTELTQKGSPITAADRAVLMRKLPYDPVEGFTAITLLSRSQGFGLIVSGTLFIVDALSLRYVDWGAFGGTLLIMPAVLFTALVLLTESAEWALSLWRVRRKSLPIVDFGATPRVSIFRWLGKEIGRRLRLLLTYPHET